jgi:uncharacterized membrane protein YhaH (DUF805 family)
MGSIHSLVRARNVVVLAVADVVLFVIANVTAKNSSHPGTLSNVVWVAFLIGVLMLIVLGTCVLVRRLRSSARPA